MLKFLLYSFLFIFIHVSGVCTVDVNEDVIFLLDFSSSMTSDEFDLMKNFTATITRDFLPSGSRVACLGFGTYPVEFFNFNSYRSVKDGLVTDIPESFTPKNYSDLIIQQAGHYRGATNLGKAIRAILSGSPEYLIDNPIIDEESLCCRKTLLIIMTDGIATDLLGPVKEDLFATNTKTIVVGIGNGFVSNYMEQIVEDPLDIRQVLDFDQLELFLEDIGEYLCEADAVISITELKVTGSNKFVEFINLGAVLQSNEIKIISNMFPGSGEFTLPESPNPISTQDVVIIHETGVTVAWCELSPKCHPFEITGGTLTDRPTDWQFTFKQIFIDAHSSGHEPEITSAALSYQDLASGLVDLAANTYSYELKVSPLGASVSNSVNWGQSCDLNGSPGNVTVQFYDCTTRCSGADSTECNPGTCEIQENGQYGCSCPLLGYKTRIHSCVEIERPGSCNVTGLMPVGVTNESDTEFAATVTYELPQDPTIAGFKFTWAGGANLADFRGGEPSYEINGEYSDFEMMYVYSVGDYECWEFTIPGEQESQLSCRVDSTSTPLKCENQLIFQPSSVEPTKNPTVPPTAPPSLSPSYSQPTVTVFFPEWADSSNHYMVNNIRYFNQTAKTSLQDLIITLRIYGTSNSYDTVVRYELVEVFQNGTIAFLQGGSWTFPPSALYVADTKEINFGTIDMQKGAIAERHLRFQLVPTTDTDSLGRLMYTLSNPSYGDVMVTYEAPLVTSQTETESFPWWMLPAIIGGCILVILVAGYCIFKQRKLRQKADDRREEAEEDVRRAEDGFFQGLDVVTENPLGEIKLRHKQKDTVTLQENVQMIQIDDDEKFEMKPTNDFATQVAYNTSGYTSEGSRIPHRKLTSDQDPRMNQNGVQVTGSSGTAPVEGTVEEPVSPYLGHNTRGLDGRNNSTISNMSTNSAYEIEEGTLPFD